MGTLACAVGELWALVNLLRPLERRDFSSRVAAQITAGILAVLALPLGGHGVRSLRPADDHYQGQPPTISGSTDRQAPQARPPLPPLAASTVQAAKLQGIKRTAVTKTESDHAARGAFCLGLCVFWTFMYPVRFNPRN